MPFVSEFKLLKSTKSNKKDDVMKKVVIGMKTII